MKTTNIITRFLPFCRLCILLGLFFALLDAASSAAAQTVEWIQQLGTSSNDCSWGVSADGLGNVYISGYTDGSLGGPNAGHRDAFISKFNASGTVLWTKQLGTCSHDASYGVSADGLGNVYISGYTEGSLGETNTGSGDAFVSKYDASGRILWTEQLGTSRLDFSPSVSADGLGNVYISGYTEGSLGGSNTGSADAFISKYDALGTLLWTEQLGTSGYDLSSGVSADGLGNVYISGTTKGSLARSNAGSCDVFVTKYDASGTLLWTEQLGSSVDDISTGVSVDGLGNVYISGWTQSRLGGPITEEDCDGGSDAFVIKFDASGTLLWTKHLGLGGFEESSGVSADGLGNVYISGHTDGGNSYNDAFVSKYDALGTLLWTKQLGSSSHDYSNGVSTDGLGNVYFSAYTEGSRP